VRPGAWNTSSYQESLTIAVNDRSLQLVNLKTEKALGITIPESFVRRADRVIR
jgi:hypothetical protein